MNANPGKMTLCLLSLASMIVLIVSHVEAREIIRNVSLDKEAFNPGDNEEVQLNYDLSRADRVSIHVYDPDGGLVKRILEGASQKAGHHGISWDGRDVEGRVVPDESYFFTLETASGGRYDPTTFSGGEVGDITRVRFDRDNTLTYKLPRAARVLIRLGIHNGPMLKTLVHWKPRVSGTITEYWDGLDENDLIRMRKQDGFTALVTYVTLPEATVIAYGNDRRTYREYKLGPARGRPIKPDRPRQSDPGIRLRPKGLVPPAWVRPPRVNLRFPSYDQGDKNKPPEVKDSISVRVNVPASDRQRLMEDQFEIMFYVDNVFFAEAERGYVPFNWEWELHQLPPGEHILTVNISSFGGQVGVASRKIRVVQGREP